jgi:hypothetical protein
MDKEVLIAIIGAISVLGAALFQSGLIPDLISNGDTEAGFAVGVSDGANDDKKNKPPVNASLEPDKPSPQKAGTAIKWTATAEDPDDASLYYRFQLEGPTTDGYRVVQDRSTKDSWVWKPAEAGNYQVLVQVWDGDHAGPSESDDFRAVSYEIKETVAKKVVPVFVSEEDPAVAASSWGEGRLDLFVRGTDGALYHRYGWSAWSEWERLGGELTSAPAAVSWGPDRIDVFALGNDSALWHIWLNGSTWSDWESLDGNWTSAPAVLSAGVNSMNVFVRGKDDALWHIWWGWDESQSKWKWSSWGSFGEYLTSAPAAVSWGPGRIDVFARGKDNDLMHRPYVFPTWSDWESLGGVLTSAPTASSPHENCLHVFFRGENKDLCHIMGDGQQWGSWESLGGELTSAPTAVYCGSSRTDIFAKGADNTLVHKWWGAPKCDWSGFETIGKWP